MGSQLHSNPDSKIQRRPAGHGMSSVSRIGSASLSKLALNRPFNAPPFANAGSTQRHQWHLADHRSQHQASFTELDAHVLAVAAEIGFALLASQTIPASLEELVLACLRKLPGARPGSARELRGRLDEIETSLGWSAQEADTWWESSAREVMASAKARHTSSGQHPGPQTMAIDWGARHAPKLRPSAPSVGSPESEPSEIARAVAQ